MNNPLNERILYQVVEAGEWRIDDCGRIWKANNQRVERIMPNGYLIVRKMREGIRLTTGAHRLVYFHFNGTIPVGLTVNHKNGIKSDNRPENLELATYSEQIKHAYKIGLKNQDGERNPAAKLTNAQIHKIREEYAAGNTTQNTIAQRYGVTFQAISKIVRGERRQTQSGPTADYTKRREHQNLGRDDNGRYCSL